MGISSAHPMFYGFTQYSNIPAHSGQTSFDAVNNKPVDERYELRELLELAKGE